MTRSWARAARWGQAAWLVGNTYEAVVGVPELVADSRGRRRAGVLGAGSPLRFYAPVAPVAVGATARVLVGHARAGHEPRLVAIAGTGFAAAVGLTVPLVRVAARPLLTGSEPLGDDARRRLVRTWHAGNAVRVVCLLVGVSAFSRLEPNECRRAGTRRSSRRGSS